jgi:hypothetical protein
MVKNFFILVLCFVSILLAYMLMKADLSLQNIRSESIVDQSSRLPKYLISYADGDEVFFKNQHSLVYSAQNKGFDIFINYRKSLLDKSFVKENQDILNIKTGAGLWLWKPQIILQTMKIAPENSIILYIDVGFIVVRDFLEIEQKMTDCDVLLMHIDDYVNNEKLINWLPKKIAKEFGIDTTKQPKFIESGIIVVKNTSTARSFIKKWLEICQRRDYAFLKYNKEEDGIKGFTYDQSLLSIIADRYPENVKVIPKEQIKKISVYHHRHPNNNKPIIFLQTLPLKQIREWLGKHFPKLFLYIHF